MNEQELINAWKTEESIAHIHGWDFSHIARRYTEEMDLPWDYQRIILDAQECFRPIKFYDVGALVWFARIIEWEFPGFSVDCCKDRLLHAQKLLEQKGVIEGRIHRFLLVCSKSERK